MIKYGSWQGVSWNAISCTAAVEVRKKLATMAIEKLAAHAAANCTRLEIRIPARHIVWSCSLTLLRVMSHTVDFKPLSSKPYLWESADTQ